MWRIKKKDTEYFNGVIEDNTKATGKMVSNMERVSSLTRMVTKWMQNG
jgi:hypothetical protein